MGKVIVGTTMSLDGFINDRYGSLARLYPNLEELRKTEMLRESMESTGAVVMGRHAYDLAEGDFTNYEYQVPIFVLTHHHPEKAAKGENDELGSYAS
jgi:dihydrofolate reductase